VNEILVLFLVIITFKVHVSLRYDTSAAEIRPVVGSSLASLGPAGPDDGNIWGVEV
jgi:hypothetical protein